MNDRTTHYVHFDLENVIISSIANQEWKENKRNCTAVHGEILFNLIYKKK